MEVELVWLQADHIAVFDETFAFWAEVILCEMRKRPLVEAERNSLTFDVLLSNTRHDLRDIVVVSLRSGDNHVGKSVVAGQGLKSDLT